MSRSSSNTANEIKRGRNKLYCAFTFVELLAVTLVLGSIVAILFPVFANARITCAGASSLSNLKQLGIANMMYAADYDDLLPIADRWMDDLYPYVKNDQIGFDISFVERQEGEHGYAMFLPVSGVDCMSVLNVQSVPLLFQSSLLHRNAAGDLSTLPYPPRQKDSHYVTFMDSHAKAVPTHWRDSPVVVIIDTSLRMD